MIRPNQSIRRILAARYFQQFDSAVGLERQQYQYIGRDAAVVLAPLFLTLIACLMDGVCSKQIEVCLELPNSPTRPGKN